jgi:hypothetical protein
MTTAIRLMNQLACLTEDQQRNVLEYVEKMTAVSPKPPLNPYRSCADLRSDLSFDEFQQNRHDMWGADQLLQATRKEG